MFSKILFLLGAASAFVCVQAQGSSASSGSAPALPTSIGAVPPCVLNCTATAAAQAGCSSVTDINCVCTSTKFQDGARACLSSCSQADQATANGLESALCGSLSASSGAGTATSSGSGSSAGSATAPAATTASGSGATTSKPNAASSLKSLELGVGHVLGLFGVLTGMVAGAGALF